MSNRSTLPAMLAGFLILADLVHAQSLRPDSNRRVAKQERNVERKATKEKRFARPPAAPAPAASKQVSSTPAATPGTGKPSAVSGDRFAVGAVWSGTRVVNRTMTQTWQLTVTERRGKSFKGEMVISSLRSQPLTVEGTAPDSGDGSLSFTSTSKGPFQQTFTGSLNGDEAKLSFTGTSIMGSSASGTATLSPMVASTKGGTGEPPLTSYQQYRAESRAKAAAMKKEAEKLSVAQLEASLAANPKKTPEERMRWYVYSEQLEAAKYAALSPAEREARAKIGMALLGAIFGGGGGAATDDGPSYEQEYANEMARKNQEARDMRNRNGTGQ